ncbi:hypothetical protein ISS03_00985 [Patescibacteria group bacterium]|nr:hypothetical protein [Patescibacteria group bacterium]
MLISEYQFSALLKIYEEITTMAMTHAVTPEYVKPLHLKTPKAIHQIGWKENRLRNNQKNDSTFNFNPFTITGYTLLIVSCIYTAYLLYIV